MIQTFTCTLAADEVPENVKQEALRREVSLESLIKTALLDMSRKINSAASKSKKRPARQPHMA
jgi:hypothetical protein